MNNITRFFMWLIVGVVVVACTYITGSRLMILGLLVPAILECQVSNESLPDVSDVKTYEPKEGETDENNS